LSTHKREAKGCDRAKPSPRIARRVLKLARRLNRILSHLSIAEFGRAFDFHQAQTTRFRRKALESGMSTEWIDAI
jgi:hypothetical protein